MRGFESIFNFEFLDGIDAVIPFRSLGFEDLIEMAYWELRRLGENVSIDFARTLSQKYYPIAKEYGVRYFLKKITGDVLALPPSLFRGLK